MEVKKKTAVVGIQLELNKGEAKYLKEILSKAKMPSMHRRMFGEPRSRKEKFAKELESKIKTKLKNTNFGVCPYDRN